MAKGAEQAKRSSPKASQLSISGVVTPMFKLIFITVLCLTILSGLASLALGIWADSAKDTTKSLIETFSTTWKMGFGAIIGMVGGKAL
jgi:hypothetical protein